ncbi:sensor histidine kinase [Terricaulis silvestris]|uniref:histidine kinase n=1 Tax=Terricaulis silvestris TaxID=2686094 RepID=A0A6I6MMY2_9CAUL|nr:HAMP domain-containing sensor histidine kinase [Terricaulis silvestris]QGZ96670.1 Sensor histidine kinase YycG [Terricaulis silvestris]
MASAIATTKPEGGRGEGLRAVARSRIARIIFIWNFAGLFVLVLGVLLLTEMRAGLTDAQFRNLRTQGELITNLLIETGTVEGDPYPYVNEVRVRDTLRRILPPIAEGARGGVGQPRVRMFADDGRLIADSDVIYDRLEETALPEVGQEESIGQSIRRTAQRVEYIRLTPWRPTISLEEEIARAQRGEIARGERLNEKGERVVSVTLPLRRVQAVMGTVTIESADVERILVAERASMIPFVLGATVAIFLSSLLLALFIARPLRTLAQAADSLRLSGSTRLSLPDVSRRKDEIGALSHSMEAMTGALADRIDANERFAADVSHEIKNPLASIKSAVESARNAREPAQQTQMLAIVAQDVQRLDRLVTDIARASRIEAETARGDLGKVDLGALLYELTRAYAPAPDEELKAPVVFKGDRPAGVIVLGQEGPLGQVFRNLIDNARSFSPPGGMVTVTIEILKNKDGSIVRAQVEDQGPGIPPENLETVFERFYTQRPKGVAFGGNSGLGLSIARQIVTSHGGRIFAQNLDGLGRGERGGARLIVELPLAAAARA